MHRFVSLNQSATTKQIYAHYTCATDTQQIKCESLVPLMSNQNIEFGSDVFSCPECYSGYSVATPPPGMWSAIKAGVVVWHCRYSPPCTIDLYHCFPVFILAFFIPRLLATSLLRSSLLAFTPLASYRRTVKYPRTPPQILQVCFDLFTPLPVDAKTAYIYINYIYIYPVPLPPESSDSFYRPAYSLPSYINILG